MKKIDLRELQRLATVFEFTLVLVIGTLASFIAVALVLWVKPIEVLPKPDEAYPLLGILLGAQAAIAALTLAVTLFLMQGISARQESDDRIYREYIRRTWLREIF